MQEMHLMAHSMGCELVTAALEHLERLNQDGCFSFFFPLLSIGQIISKPSFDCDFRWSMESAL